mgnify:CR=1 FL=1
MTRQELKLFGPRLLESTVVTILALCLWSCASQTVILEDAEWKEAPNRQQVNLSATLKTLDGKDVSLSNLEGKVLFVNFWATWCGPCRAEMPSMVSLFHKLSTPELGMVAISDEDSETVRQFLEDNPYPFDVWLDPKNVLAERFDIRAIPTTLIVDSQGRLVMRHTGIQQWDSPKVIEGILQLLRESRKSL